MHSQIIIIIIIIETMLATSFIMDHTIKQMFINLKKCLITEDTNKKAKWMVLEQNMWILIWEYRQFTVSNS